MTTPTASQPQKHNFSAIARGAPVIYWLALAGISLAAFAASINDVEYSPGTDLRCRVVGARAMMLGLDPYFTPASSNQIQTLQDPDRYAAICTRCTYSPALLCTYVPLANLAYQTQRFIWFAIEWCAMTGSILLLRSILPRGRVRDVFTTVAVLFFAAGSFWELHLERGQYYIFVVFLLSLTSWLCMGRSTAGVDSPSRDQWWNGIPLGIAAALRLTPLAALPPLWLSGFRRTAIGAAVAFVACISGTLAIAGPSLWGSYFRSVSIQSRLTYDSDYFQSQHAQLPPIAPIVENVNFDHRVSIPCANVTLAMDVLKPLADGFAWMPGPDQWQLFSRAAAALICLLFILAMRRRTLGALEALAAAFICVMSVDFCLPSRISYADVLFVVPVALLAPSMLSHRAGRICFAFIILTLAMCDTIFAAWLPISLLRPPLMMLGLLSYLLLQSTRRILDASAQPDAVMLREACPA